MKLPFRQALTDSHISAVAIVILLVWSLEWTFQAVWEPFLRLAEFLITAVAIHDIPTIFPAPNFEERRIFLNACFYLFNALSTVAAAWLLSRWVYGTGPIRTLRSYRGAVLSIFCRAN